MNAQISHKKIYLLVCIFSFSLKSTEQTGATHNSVLRSNSPVLERLTTAYGPMCGGKSEYLLKKAKELSNSTHAPLMLSFIHSIGMRQLNQITSRSARVIPQNAVPISSAHELKNAIQSIMQIHNADREVAVILDEAQFFSPDEKPNLTTVVEELHATYKNISLFFAGLDKTFTGKGFNCMPELIERAASPIALVAYCQRCHSPAYDTQRLIDGKPAGLNDPVIIPDGSRLHVTYEPRCPDCYEPPK